MDLKRGSVVRFSPDIDNRNLHGCVGIVMHLNVRPGEDGGVETDAPDSDHHIAAVVAQNYEHQWVGFREEDVEYIGESKWLPDFEWTQNI